YWLIVLVYDLDDEQILMDVQPVCPGAFDSDQASLGRTISTENVRSPELPGKIADIGSQGFSDRGELPWSNPKPSSGLLLREPPDHRWIGDHDLGVIGIEYLDHLRKRRGYGQPRSIVVPGPQLGEQPVGDVKRRGGTDAQQAGALRDLLNT